MGTRSTTTKTGSKAADIRTWRQRSRKRPAAADFRVQEEHGSEVIPVVPEPALLAAGNAAIAAVGQKLLYARADLVRSDDVFSVMELELVEPALYLRMDPAAPDRFAEAVDSCVRLS